MKCACCGKSVRKWTTTVYLEEERTPYHLNSSGNTRYVYPNELGIPWPRTMADCQKLSNQKVVSAERGVYWRDTGPRYEKDRTQLVRKFTEWDGEHYLPSYGYFCSNVCAGNYAQAVVKTLRERKQPQPLKGTTHG